MSEILSFSRLGKLLKADFIENLFIILIPFILFLGSAGFVCYKLAGVFSSGNFPQNPDSASTAIAAAALASVIIYLSMAVFLCWFSSRAMRDYHHRPQATILMMLPCSVTEKFLSRWLLYVILVPLVYCMSITVGIDIFFCYYILPKTVSSATEALQGIANIPADSLNEFKDIFNIFSWTNELSVLLFIISNASLYFSGSTFFKTKVGLKTTLIFVAFLILAYSCGFFDFLHNVTSSISAEFSAIQIFTFAGLTLVTSVIAWFRFRHHTLP